MRPKMTIASCRVAPADAEAAQRAAYGSRRPNWQRAISAHGVVAHGTGYQPPGLADEGGRGLMLVDALTKRWGWNLPPSGRGKIVWALVEQ